MHDLYYNTDSPVAFSGAARLFAYAKKVDPEIRYKDVLNFFRSKRSFSYTRADRERDTSLILSQQTTKMRFGSVTFWTCLIMYKPGMSKPMTVIVIY